MTTALLIKMSSLGDVVHTLPAVTDAALAGVTFDWVVEESFAPIAALHPAVRNVIPIAWRRWRRNLSANRAEMQHFRSRLKDEHYDVILDSQGLAKSWAVSRMVNGELRAGFAADSARERMASLFVDKAVHVPKALHAIDRQRQLFAQVFGYVQPPGFTYGLGRHHARTDSDATRTCLILHGTTWSSKLYPDVLWQELVTLARADGFNVVLTWGNDEERQRADHVATAGATVWPQLSLAGLSEAMAGVSLVIGVDSGLTHLAAALDVPTIALYGSTDPVLTGVRGRHADSLSATFPCAPCRSATCKFSTDRTMHDVMPPCYGSLAPKQIWQAAKRQLGQAS
jgi:heptosyltransferase I